MDDQKNVRPDFSKAGEDSALYRKTEDKTERQKLSELHGQDKAWYLWQYYGLKAVIVLAIAGVAVFLIVQRFTEKESALGILAVNAMQIADNPVDESGYYDDFLSDNGIDTKKYKVTVSSGLGANTNENDSASVQSIQMIENRFMTQTADVFFADYDFFYSLGEFDYMADIRDYLPEELLKRYEDDLVYVKSVETGKKYPIGIKLEDNAWIEETGWYPDSCVVGLAEGLKNSDLAVGFIEKILED